MRHLLRHIALTIAAMAPLLACAVEAQHDTLYFYNTWEQMLYFEPVSMLQDPFIYAHSPMQVFFEIEDEKWNSVIEHDFLGASMGDSIWYINGNYLKTHFDGDINLLNDYIPLFFNEKVAYFRFGGYPYRDEPEDYTSYEGKLHDSMSRAAQERSLIQMNWNYYYIDFERHKILKVNHNVLSDLLKDYHDLLMRYEGMKDYKKREIIEDYFLRYIDRATTDVMHPYILDLVEDTEE